MIDTMNGELLVVTLDRANSYKPALFRCNLDGTACTYTDISAGQAAESGYQQSALVDRTNAKLLVTTANGANSYKPALFSVCL